MECAQTQWLTNKEYMERFNQRAASRRIPLSGSFELTRRCNLGCVHCYLGPQAEQRKLRDRELTTDQAKFVIDELVSAGMLFLQITGGDPLLRPDFAEIYRHAALSGLMNVVFTNATLVTDRTVELFRELPPQAVEITLYGATAATYERITTVPGSYARCIAGIERLLAGGAHVKLKTIAMAGNRHEYYAMEAMARRYRVPFRMDAAIFGGLSGDKAPLALRLDPAEAVEFEMSDPERRRQWRKYLEGLTNTAASDYIYQCGAGLTALHVDAFGNMHPCIMAEHVSYSILKLGFRVAWQGIGEIRQRKADAGKVCASCHDRAACGYCPGFSAVDCGDEQGRSDYLCALGQQRIRLLFG